jgi:ATP-dependent RNA helicase DHX57
MVFLQKRQTSKIYVYDCSVVGIFALILLGGSIDIDYQRSIIKVGSDYVIDCPAKSAALLKALRAEFENLFASKLDQEENTELWNSPVTASLYHVLTYQGYDDK